MELRELKIGESARVIKVGGEGALRQHFLDMGLIPGVRITMVKYAPMGDPMELRIHNYELTLRLDDAKKILIDDVQKETEDNAIKFSEFKKKSGKSSKHPGLGEAESPCRITEF